MKNKSLKALADAILKMLPDKPYIKIRWKLSEMNYSLNLKHPNTFNEKLQWLKLYDHNPLYTTMVDKYAVKDYVADIIGDEYIIPTLGVWDRAEDIDWDELPNRFVLKCTHDSGTAIIVDDKNKLDKNDTTRKLNKWLKRDYYLVDREWPYKNVQRKILAEQFIQIEPEIKDLPDYKFFCFNGEVKAMFVATERHNLDEEVKFDFFDSDFNHLPFRQGHDNAKITPPKPKNFELMKQLSQKLSKGLPQVRVDLYDLGNRVLFGELTFFHFSGMVPFEPKEWDERFGDWIILSSNE